MMLVVGSEMEKCKCFAHVSVTNFTIAAKHSEFRIMHPGSNSQSLFLLLVAQLVAVFILPLIDCQLRL